MKQNNSMKTILENTARSAGAIASSYFRRLDTHAVHFKKTADLVTEVDYQIEQQLRNELGRVCPDVAFVGEESTAESTATTGTEGGGEAGGGSAQDDSAPAGTEKRFIADPLDGTTNFVHGIPFFSISIAYVEGERIEAGIVYAPELELMYSAERGGGAFCNGEQITASPAASLSEAVIATGFASLRKETGPDNLSLFNYLLPRVRGIRRFGSAAVDFCYVAEGRFDLFWEYGLDDWDIAAGALIAQEAGARVTTLSGSEQILGAHEVLAAHPKLHDEFLRLIASRPET
jgi:myo-inositol-1(or 4)-monophosphatase